MDVHSKEQRRKNMQAIKSRRTRIEEILAKALWKEGLRYRRNNKKVFGKPDFTFGKYKIAIFCDSEFFHGKDWGNQKKRIKTNVEFWHNKIENNIRRDLKVKEVLESEGWLVLRFWGETIKKETEYCVNRIKNEIEKRK